jgi:glycosyltransferase involved in cell wall biosynthesis
MNQRPLNVVQIVAFLPVGGMENLLLRTLPLFDKLRFHIRICCTYKRGSLADRFEEKGIPVDVCRVRSRLHPIDIWALSRWLKKEKIDIVHTHMYASNITGVIAARLARIPVIISHVHSLHEWNSRNRIWMEKIADHFRSGAIVNSEFVKQAFIQKIGIPHPEKVKVLYNVAPLTNTHPGDPERIRRELGIPPHVRIIGAVSRLVHKKGVDLFIRAAAEIRKSHPEAFFLIAGKGKELENLFHLTESLNLKGQVLFAGERKDMENIYPLFDIFVLSSRDEPFGMVLLEAMQFKIPIVATAVGGVPEVVNGGKAALLIPPESPHEMAAAIIKLLDDPLFAQKLGEQGSVRAKDFPVEKYVQTLEQYYENLWENESRSRKSPVKEAR